MDVAEVLAIILRLLTDSELIAIRSCNKVIKGPAASELRGRCLADLANIVGGPGGYSDSEAESEK